MGEMEILKKAAGLPSLWLGVASVISGTAAASAHGNANPVGAMACLLFAVFMQIASNIGHRYYDEVKGYGENDADGFGRYKHLDLPVKTVLKEGLRASSIIAATAGLALLAMSDWWTLIVAALLLIIGVVNNMGPKPLSRSVFYPLATFFIFGPIAVLGTELVQFDYDAASIMMIRWQDFKPGIISSIVMGLMALNCHVIYGAFHRRTNVMRSRTTFYGRYGRKSAMTLLTVNTLIYTAICIATPYMMQLYPWWIFIPVSLISMFLDLYIIFFLLRPGSWKLAWRLSLVNIVFMAAASLVVFSIVGYP